MRSQQAYLASQHPFVPIAHRACRLVYDEHFQPGFVAWPRRPLQKKMASAVPALHLFCVDQSEISVMDQCRRLKRLTRLLGA